MAFGTQLSAPARFGDGQSAADSRDLFLKIFGGEVLTAFTEKTIMMDKHNVRTIANGKSAAFPKTWKATAEYHAAGQEMLGNDIDTSEVTITVDGLLVSHVGIYDLDEKMAHFDVTGEFSAELGRSLARAFDRNVFRQLVLAARTAAVGPFPGGNVITDAALTSSGAIDGKAWIDGIRAARIQMFNKDVPEDMPYFMTVNAAVFDAIKYAKDANGRYLAIHKELNVGSNGGFDKRGGDTLEIEGVQIMRSRLMPSTNETSDTTVYSKYRANYATTTGVLWTPMAVGTVKLLDLAMETERDVRRQEDFMVAKMAVGHGVLRPECAVEFKTA